jgi:hypothetical protein
MNKLRTAYGKPLTITSGFRTEQKQREIYKNKGHVPMGSKHLSCEACDVYDPNKDLQQWLLVNIKLLEEIGLWIEHFDATPNWCHFQTCPPKSGLRFFKP